MINLQKRQVMKKLTFLFFCIIGISTLGFAQNSYLMGTHRIVTEGCEATIYDDGGDIDNYGNSRMDTITIYSNDANNPKVQFIFNVFNIDAGDTLFIYDSNIANPAKLISGGILNLPWFNNTNPITTGVPFFTASPTNTSGAITLRFKTNSSDSAPGFKITSLCSGGCQQIIATINPNTSNPTLITENNILYSNLCSFVTLSLNGQGNYPENNITYQQSDNTSLFTWTINDTAVFSGIGLTSFTPPYPIIRASEIKLSIKDNHNCTSNNNSKVRIRPSLNPIISSPSIITTCVGDSLLITAGNHSTDDIFYYPVGSTTQSSYSADSARHIPDGPNCPQLGDCLTSSIMVSNASPTQTIQSVNDIKSLILKIEHSYIGDLDIKLFCPNGQATVIHSFSNGGGIFLGTPIDDQGSCDFIPQLLGSGWNYAWSENTTMGFTYHGASPYFIHLSQLTPFADSTNLTTNSNYYKPMQSFGSLIGCPILGVWSLTICDHYAIDDGNLFNWSLNFNPSIISSSTWGYQIPINEVLWAGPYINTQTDSSVLIIPTASGTYQYTYSVVDDYGCAYDSTFAITAIGSIAEITYNYPLLTSNILEGNQWHIETNSGIFSIPGATSQTYEPYETATYYTVISGNNCASDTSNKIFVDLSNSLNESSKLNFGIIPNPSKGVFQIRLSSLTENTRVNLLSIEGKIIFSQMISDKTSTYDVSQLSKGIYFIELNNSLGRIMKKLIIE